MPDTTAVEDRLFSLVLALLATDQGLTKADILSSVHGYSRRYRPGDDNLALDRQFERDKDDIRELGVPLETIDPPEDPGNNQLTRYRIRRGDYDLPSDVRFTAEETALLGLAAAVWREGEVGAESRRALLKLRGIAPTGADPVLGYQPRVRSRDAAFDPLRKAIDRGQIVRFRYLRPGQTEAGERVMIPLAVVSFESRWHLYAEDPESGLRKLYLLRRIVGRVSAGKAAPARPGDHAADALAVLERLRADNAAVVRVDQDSDAARRLGARVRAAGGAAPTDAGELRVPYVDLAILADELAAFGPEVTAVAPPELVDAVRARLAEVVADHG